MFKSTLNNQIDDFEESIMSSLVSKILITLLANFLFSCGNKNLSETQRTNHNQQIISEYYEENGLFVLDKFLIRKNALPQRITHQEFGSKEARRDFLREQIQNGYIGQSIFVDYEYDLVAREKIWEVKNEWSLEWEAKYSQWIKKEFHQNFFLDHKISTDCADVAFVLRWIFARINSLPAANTMAGSGKIFSQDSFIRKWSRLKRNSNWYEDEVFLAALEFLKNTTYTKTLKRDTYPVVLSVEAFREGVIQLNPTHVRVISNIVYDGSAVPILKQYSTRPSAIRPMAREVMLNFKSIAREKGGFVKFRWPKKVNKSWELVESEKMKWFSLEQYQEKFLDGSVNFTNYLMDTLKIKRNARATITSMLGAIKEFVFQRDQIVAQGYDFCLNNSCELGTVAYEDWSTPSRDKRVVEFFDKIDLLIEENTHTDPMISEFYEELKVNTFVDLRFAQIGISLKEAEDMFRASYLSYDPRDKIALRWAQDYMVQHLALKIKVQRLLKIRQDKVEKAKECREDQTCIEGTDSYKSLNTVDLDIELKKYIKNIRQLCDISVEYCFLIWNPDIMNIKWYESEPNLSLNKRYGIRDKESPPKEMTKRYD